MNAIDIAVRQCHNSKGVCLFTVLFKKKTETVETLVISFERHHIERKPNFLYYISTQMAIIMHFYFILCMHVCM